MITQRTHTSRLALAAGFAAACSTTQLADAAIIADSVADYATVQGQDGWFYGYYDGDGGDPFNAGDFEQMTYGEVNFKPGTFWWAVQNGAGGFWTLLDEVGGHPNALLEASDRQRVTHWAVRRYVSEAAGPVRFTGTLADRDTNAGIGDGVTGRIFVDGVEVYSQAIAAGDDTGVTYDFTVPVNLGSIIDFAIDANENDAADAATFTAVLEVVPEPGTLALVGLAGLFMAKRRHTRG